MKKMILFLLLNFLFLFTYAQTRESLYHLESFGKSFEVKVSRVDGTYFEFSIYCPSFDGKDAGLILRKPDIPAFVENLNKVKAKFAEWNKTAKDNNVKNFQQKIEVDFHPIKAFFIYGNDSHYYYGTKLYPFFFVNADGKASVSILTGELIAQDNKYIKSKGIALVFVSNQEIDNFIKTLNAEAVLKDCKPKEELEKLFK